MELDFLSSCGSNELELLQTLFVGCEYKEPLSYQLLTDKSFYCYECDKND